MNNITTVMGPGQSSTQQRSITDPPLFQPDQDNLEWRKQVASWVELIEAGAKSSRDKLFITAKNTLGYLMFERGLSSYQKSIVSEAQVRGTIDYKQADQVVALKQIVSLVAVDKPITVVTILIDTFSKVIKCCRLSAENLNTFT